MWTYQAPVADMLYGMDAVLVALGDLAGCSGSPEGVAMPPGHRAACQAFVAGWWPALACTPESGSQGLPLNAALFKILAAANHGWIMYPGLLLSACEQTVRDSRIALICEGSNEIPAVDRVQRKLLDDGGARSDALMQELACEVAACQALPALQPFAAALAQQLLAWREVQQALLAGRPADPEWPLWVADDVLHGIGHALMCWAWARITRSALDPARPTPPGGRSAAQWLQSARFGLDWLLPQAQVHWGRALRADAAQPFLAA